MTLLKSEYDKYLHFPIISCKLDGGANEKSPVPIIGTLTLSLFEKIQEII